MAMKFRDYYQLLGVAKGASADEVKKAYRKKAREFHPDVSKAADAAERMAEINEAWNVLSDPDKRSTYDAVGAQAWAAGARHEDDLRPPPGWQSGFDAGGAGRGTSAAGEDAFAGAHRAGFGDDADHSAFFEELFGRAARAQRQESARDSGPIRGGDQHARIDIDVVDACRGTERTITLRGARFDAQGRVVEDTRSLQVKIPAGVRDGQMIRLAGQGGQGFNGGGAGDLLLEVRLQGNEHLRVDGADIVQRFVVTPWEAALGAELQVQTPAGDRLSVHVPRSSNAGRKLRLKGKGLPATARSPAGDLFLELAIAVPGAVTDAQQQAWAQLAEAYPGFNPRSA